MKSKIPKWVRLIPHNKKSHGSGILQKKLWKLVSDYVRIRDWHAHGGACVAVPGIKIKHWSYGDAGHFKSYQDCNGIFKFDPINIHLQSKASNGWGGQDIGHAFGEELKRRYGPDILQEIEKQNRDTPLKFMQGEIIEHMKWLIDAMGRLPEQPDYYHKLFISDYDPRTTSLTAAFL